MAIIKLFDHKTLFLAFRDTVANVLQNDLSITLKPRRLDEVAAHLSGAKDFNTALGLIERTVEASVNVQALIKALEIVKRSRDYLAETGEYPRAFRDLMGSDQLIDDYLADVAEQALSGQSCTLDLSVFDLPEQSLRPLSLYVASPANHIPVPADSHGEYIVGWRLADMMSCEGRLNPTMDAPIILTDDQAVGFWDRQSIEKNLYDKVSRDQRQIIDLINVNIAEVDKRFIWRSGPCMRTSDSSFDTYAEAQADAYDRLGVNWYGSPHETRLLAKEGLTVGYVHTEESGFVMQLMGYEADDHTIPYLSDEEAWLLVIEKARELGMGSIYGRLLVWLEKVSPSDYEQNSKLA